MKIKDLQPGINRVNIESEVLEKGLLREFEKFGRKGKVCEVKIRDDTGEFILVLWDDEVDKVQQGNRIKITNGYVKRYQGEPQLLVGRYGLLEIIE